MELLGGQNRFRARICPNFLMFLQGVVVGREYDLDSQSSVDEIAFDISLIEDVVIGIHGYN